MRTIKLLIITLFLTESVFAQSGIFYNVRDYGAKGDGNSIDTKAIDAAITAASENGGGTVFFPAGTYLSFTIHLKSFITLHLDNGAILEAADVGKYGLGYDPAEPNQWDLFQDFGHSHWRNSLIYGESLQNIAITGLGTIFGNGLTREGFKTPGMANKAIALKLCSNVVIYSENPKYCSMIVGIPGHPVEDVRLSNILIRIKGGAPKEQALYQVGEHEKSYPDPQEFGDMPAYGFFIRHAKNIELNHVELKLENNDFRPALILDDVTGANLDNLIVSKVGSVPSIILKDARNILIKDCQPFKNKQISKITSTQF